MPKNTQEKSNERLYQNMTTYPTTQLPNPESFGIKREDFKDIGQGNRKILRILERKGYPAVVQLKQAIEKRKKTMTKDGYLQATATWVLSVLFNAPVVEIPKEEVKVERKQLRHGGNWYKLKKDVEAIWPIDGWASPDEFAKFATTEDIVNANLAEP